MREGIFALFLFFLPSSILGAVVGSSTTPSRQASYDFLAADGDNEMRGFAYFENGFTLENSSTSCLYTSFFPVSGTFCLNNGTLNLNRNLILSSNAVFGNAGKIDGNGYALEMPCTTTLELTHNHVLISGASELTFIDDESIGVQINSVDWSYDDNYIAVGVQTNGGNELYVYSFNGSALTLEASASFPESVYSVRWHPSNYFIAVGQQGISGNELYIYEFTPGPDTLTQKSAVSATWRGANSIAWRPSGAYIVVGAENHNNVNGSFQIYSVSGAGALDLVTQVELDGSTVFPNNAVSWDSAGNYFVGGLGSTGSWSELRVYSFNGSTITLNTSSNIAQTVNAVAYSPTKTWIAVGLGGSTQRLRIYDHNSGSGTLTEKTAARIGETLSIRSAHWSSDGNYLLVGRDAGSGTELRVYDVNQATAALTLIDDVNFASNIRDVRWSSNQGYIAAGGNDNKISVYSFASQESSYLQGPVTHDPVILKDIFVRFNSDVIPTNPLQCQGECVIDGKGYVLDLSGTTSLAVDSGASVLLQNLIIKGVSAGNILCLDGNGTVSLENVTLLLDADYSFTQGSLEILENVIIGGPHVFTYKSSKKSTIKSHAKLVFDSGMTLKYDAPTTAKDLLAMEDATSILYLHETTLHSTTTGLRLTKGTLVLEGTCPVISDATVEAEAIMLGDGASSVNNIDFKILPGSGFRIDSGFLAYKNV